MSEDDTTGGGDGPNWLKWGLGLVAVVAALVVFIALFGWLFKWALLALALYAVYRVGRRLLGGSSSEKADAPALLEDDSREPDRLLEFEKDQELEQLKARVEADRSED